MASSPNAQKPLLSFEEEDRFNLAATIAMQTCPNLRYMEVRDMLYSLANARLLNLGSLSSGAIAHDGEIVHGKPIPK